MGNYPNQIHPGLQGQNVGQPYLGQGQQQMNIQPLRGEQHYAQQIPQFAGAQPINQVCISTKIFESHFAKSLILYSLHSNQTNFPTWNNKVRSHSNLLTFPNSQQWLPRGSNNRHQFNLKDLQSKEKLLAI